MPFTEALVLAVTFVGLLVIGVPIAFCLGLAGLAAMLVNIPALPAVATFAQRIATGLDSFALLAIPFFVLAGQIMNRGGIAHRLIDFAKVLVGRLPGGLAYVNIVACMLFGAISGSSVAAASAVGGIMTPKMANEGYPRPFAAAVNITSATTGLIIPPSNILIIYSLASGGVSISALFLAGYVPGVLVGVCLMVAAAVMSRRAGYPTGQGVAWSERIRKFFAAVPSLMLLVIVIGGIVAGIFTPTEASVIAVVYTLGLAFAYREIKVRDLPKILLDTVTTTSVVLLLIGTSIGMSWVMSFANIPQTVTEVLLALSDNPFFLLLIINVTLLAVGVFMDMTPAVLIFTPIFLPVVTKLGLDPTHFGIMMVLNLCIGLCTPPVGAVLFVGCGVARVSIAQVIRPILPMFFAMLAALLLVSYIPALSLFLPRLFGLLS
jgi:tripartite ATP-independent transporter DctM subunit